LTKTELIKTEWTSARSFIYGDVVIGCSMGRVDTYNIRTGEQLWRGGQWNWEGIHNGWIYYSTRELNGTHTSVNMIEVTTGKLKKLYEEPLPEECLGFLNKRPPAITSNDDIKVTLIETKEEAPSQAPEDKATKFANPQR
jgi:hypothetical protein